MRPIARQTRQLCRLSGTQRARPLRPKPTPTVTSTLGLGARPAGSGALLGLPHAGRCVQAQQSGAHVPVNAADSEEAWESGGRKGDHAGAVRVCHLRIRRACCGAGRRGHIAADVHKRLWSTGSLVVACGSSEARLRPNSGPAAMENRVRLRRRCKDPSTRPPSAAWQPPPKSRSHH